MSFTSIPRHLDRTLILLALALAASELNGQAAQTDAAKMRIAGSLGPDGISREIDDPSSGAHWLLVRNNDHPGGPGSLLLDKRLDAGSRSPQIPSFSSLVPVIRAGDVVILEEHTPAVDIRLEAIALVPARIAAVLRVRLKLGGRIVRAIASGPGRATLAPDSEAWP